MAALAPVIALSCCVPGSECFSWCPCSRPPISGDRGLFVQASSFLPSASEVRISLLSHSRIVPSHEPEGRRAARTARWPNRSALRPRRCALHPTAGSCGHESPRRGGRPAAPCCDNNATGLHFRLSLV
jgi:hypothetical protein